MNSVLMGIEEILVKEFIEFIDERAIKYFEYKTSINDIDVIVRGMVYGDFLSFRRGRIEYISIKSSVHKISKKDIEEFSQYISDKLYKIINTMS